MQAEFYDFYEKASDWLRLLARSEIRIKILANLNEGVKNLGELREVLDLSSSTILHGMRGMELEALIENTATGYALTNIGKIQTILINDLIKSIAVLSKDRDFWLSHDISGIPEPLLKKIGLLSDCEVVRSTTTDLFKPLLNYIQMLSRSKKLSGISPIFHPDFSKAVKKMLSERISIQLIFNDEILDKAIESDAELVKELSARESCGVWLNDDLRVAFTVTDKFISLGLFNNDGTYDNYRDLVGYSEEAIAWGNELFEYYTGKSKKVEL